MTIQEAIKGGKLVKRKAWADYLRFGKLPDGTTDVFADDGQLMGSYGRLFTVEDILATDWETKPD